MLKLFHNGKRVWFIRNIRYVPGIIYLTGIHCRMADYAFDEIINDYKNKTQSKWRIESGSTVLVETTGKVTACLIEDDLAECVIKLKRDKK